MYYAVQYTGIVLVFCRRLDEISAYLALSSVSRSFQIAQADKTLHKI